MSQDFYDPEIFADFIIEAKEHLETIEPNLLELEKAPDNLSLLNDIFRPMHSLKGASGFLGLNKINQLAHKSENILDELRKGTIQVNSEIMDVILASTDALSQIINNLNTINSEGDVETSAIIEQIESIMRGESIATSAPAPTAAEPAFEPELNIVEQAEQVFESDNIETIAEIMEPEYTEQISTSEDNEDSTMSSQDWILTLNKLPQYPLTAFGEGHLKDFIDEAKENLQNLSDGLLTLEENSTDSEKINDIFRYFHNIKGNSGIIGYNELNTLTHEAETLFNKVRHNDMQVSRALVDELLLVVDVMEDMINSIEPSHGVASPVDALELVNILKKTSENGEIHLPKGLEKSSQNTAPSSVKTEANFASTPLIAVGADKEDDDLSVFSVTVRQQLEVAKVAFNELAKDASQANFQDALYRALIAIQNSANFMGFDEIKVYAERTASIVDGGRKADMDFSLMLDLLTQEFAIIDEMIQAKIQAQIANNALATASVANPTSVNTAPVVNTQTNRQEVNPIDNFANSIVPPPSSKKSSNNKELDAPVKAEAQRAASTPTPNTEANKTLEAPKATPAAKPIEPQKVVTPPKIEVPSAPIASQVDSTTAPVAPITPVVQKPVEPAKATITPTAPAKPADAPKTSAPPANAPTADATKSTIRVDHEKLDHLMNLIGELIINRNRYTMLARKLEEGNTNVTEIAQDLSETTYGMARISDDLQDTIMKVRMVPVSSVFSRFPRLVRDLSRKSNKEVELILEGEETELDKSVVEVIGDPLVHLIRNSVDHGIESAADRIAAGKNPIGRVVLRAFHKGNSVAIEIEDDGKGIDPEKMREAAVRKGVLTPEEAKNIDDRDAINLIFAPGFSTAAQVTDISGRGVGMDVVRTNIKNLKGSINTSSEVGKGTKFTLLLPLTLAIIDVLMVVVNNQSYAIPLDSVSETTKLEVAKLSDIKGRKAITLRGEVLGIVNLAEMLNLPFKPASECKEISVVVIHDNERRLGLIVDRLLERQEIVIKPLGTYLGELRGISGATIMGDGGVILILDPHEMYKLATTKPNAKTQDN